MIGIKPYKWVDSEVLLRKIKSILRFSFKTGPDEEDPFSIFDQQSIEEVARDAAGIIKLFGLIAASISLIVGSIGVMNIMLVSVRERTREIGILKALGMKSRTVLLIFLSEAVIVGLMGAIIGVGLGWGLANIVATVFSGAGVFGSPGGNPNAVSGTMTITPVLTPTVFLGALAFGVVVSVVFALYPAWRASKLKPVDALRYE